jgi:type I restriction enzyme R subunit
LVPLASANFRFLEPHGAQLYRLAALAEFYFPADANTCLLKLRQFAELLAQDIAARASLFTSTEEPFVDLLGRLSRSSYVPRRALDLFHHLRRAGNAAAHANQDDHAAALSALKMARELAAWFVRGYCRKPTLSVGPFVPPKPPPDPTAALLAELARLQAVADEQRAEAERQRAIAAEHEARSRAAEERAAKEAEEREIWQGLAEESQARFEAERRIFPAPPLPSYRVEPFWWDALERQADAASGEVRAELEALQQHSAQLPAAERVALEQEAAKAADDINLDEPATRAIIDEQLRQAGWEADTVALRHANAARPIKGRNLAIAEWPTASGPADYALFSGMTLVGVVEAKRRNKNVMEVLPQAERYSRGIAIDPDSFANGAPWGDFRAPFVFSTNGRPYLKQLEFLSGIWRRDVRKATNAAGALTAWPSPQGLLERLQVDKDAAAQALREQPFDFGFPLRPYQRRAIEAVEAALERDQRNLLLAMATGTGKTKLAIAMLYRLIAAKRFRRVCFVVDRNALGNQAETEFTTTKIVSGKSFADIFGLKTLSDITPDIETRVHICTIQGLVKRVLFADDPADAPPVDQYDLMIVDECHRGYLLDREMSDSELTFRDQADYVSKYRRVLDWFDATKIGLTATPALHTVDIFGRPVFTYSYREAVIDGYLVDQEPPIRITTALAQAGIHFQRGDNVELVDTRTGQIDLAILPDAVDFEVDQFNNAVVTKAFNRVVAEELTRHIDPSLPDKTLVFAVSDAHADILVNELREAFREAYGEIEDSAIRKVTGSVDKVGKLILSYRNDTLPKIAVTVDLLTTGIDVPKITNLVFVRRVNSRILYDQMIGRATRLCPEIGKETYRIFDAVDLYPRLQNLTAMRPVVSDPKLSLTELLEELVRIENEGHRANVRDQIVVRMSRRLKKLSSEARAQFEKEAGETPEETLRRFREGNPADLAGWARDRPRLGPALDWTTDAGTPRFVPISQHPDEVISVTRGYGGAQRPEDFLDAFARFVKDNVNEIAALKTVVQRPRDLTRKELRQLRLELDAKGFSDANLRRAWADATNQDIAASIIGYIRQAALGDPLVPYSERVRRAVNAMLGKGGWTDPQRRWLKRIGEQIEKEIVVDREALDEEPFRADGGFRVLDKRFDGRLETVLADIREGLWRTAS